MRIVAGVTPGWEAYYVYHAEQCRFLYNVIWVDDETNEYGTVDTPIAPVETRKAKKIEIQTRLIIINPIEDNGDGERLFVSKPLLSEIL